VPLAVAARKVIRYLFDRFLEKRFALGILVEQGVHMAAEFRVPLAGAI
jgi:hypothetical protein